MDSTPGLVVDSIDANPLQNNLGNEKTRNQLCNDNYE